MPYSNKNILALFSFGIVVSAYWIYTILAVPYIEPAEARRKQDSLEGTDPTIQRSDRYQQLISRIFSKDSWERENPKVMETEQFLLLWKENSSLTGEIIKLKPFTAIYFNDADHLANKEKRGRPTILQAPQGAEIRVKKPTINSTRFGKIIGGFLYGHVSISSPESRPGSEDELIITTQNIRIDPNQISTLDEVSFRYGRSSGRGRGLTIKFSPSKKTQLTNQYISDSAIQSVTLSQVDKINLEVPRTFLKENKSPQLQPNTKSTKHTKASLGRYESSFVELTCEGPFNLDLDLAIARFQDNVDVIRKNPNGHSDQLNCEHLEVYYSQIKTAGTTLIPSKAEIKKIVATGYPVIARSPLHEGLARGQRLTFEAETNQLTLEMLEGEDPVTLHHQKGHVVASWLRYELTESGRLGRLWANGPGHFQGQLEKPHKSRATNKESFIDADWTNQFSILPQDDNKVLSLTGKTSVRFDRQGEINANQIHLWLLEVPETSFQGKTKYSFLPSRLMAKGDVEFFSEKIKGGAQLLEAWFEQGKTPFVKKNTRKGLVFSNHLDTPETQKEKTLIEKIDVQGDLLRMLLVWNGRKSKIEDIQAKEITAEGNVEFSDAKGLSLLGDDFFQYEQESNRFWIKGPGKLNLKTRQAQQETTLSMPNELAIVWKKAMTFDGKNLHFDGSVNTNVKSQEDQTQRETEILSGMLDITLREKIDFRDLRRRIKPELKKIIFSGDQQSVTLRSQSWMQGKPESIEHMNAPKIEVDLQLEEYIHPKKGVLTSKYSGQFTAPGPGWISTVRFEDDSQKIKQGLKRIENSTKPRELFFSHVDYLDRVTGKINRGERNIEFRQSVKIIYGPASDWNVLTIEKSNQNLGEKEILLKSDLVRIFQLGEIEKGSSGYNLVARGNTEIEGKSFMARGQTASYSQAKDLFTLDGGSSNADIWQQKVVGNEPKHAAGKRILYWHTAQHFEIDDAQGAVGNSRF